MVFDSSGSVEAAQEFVAQGVVCGARRTLVDLVDEDHGVGGLGFELGADDLSEPRGFESGRVAREAAAG